jgi:hypothetical protein
MVLSRSRIVRDQMRTLVLLLVAVLISGCQLNEEGRTPRTVSLEDFKEQLQARKIWLGGGIPKFEEVGRGTFATAIEQGLMPDHRVLDIGAGSLRIGWWLLQYIEPSNYYVIEPVKERVHNAVEILGAHDIHIYNNMDFEFPRARFDFVIARSIWTHSSKGMIAKMLSEFAENSSQQARFLASVKLAESEDQDYKGDVWVGRVENVGRAAVVRHSQEWLEQEAENNGLMLQVLGELTGQTWVVILRPEAVKKSWMRPNEEHRKNKQRVSGDT